MLMNSVNKWDKDQIKLSEIIPGYIKEFLQKPCYSSYLQTARKPQSFIMIGVFLEAVTDSIKMLFIDLIFTVFKLIMKITGTILNFALVSIVAGEGFASGLSRQKALKSLRHQDLNLVDANFDWLESPTIRFVHNLNLLLIPLKSYVS